MLLLNREHKRGMRLVGMAVLGIVAGATAMGVWAAPNRRASRRRPGGSAGDQHSGTDAYGNGAGTTGA